MKKLSLALLVLIATPAFADTAPPAADSPLATNMKHIGKVFKAIKTTVTDPAQNTANAANAAQLITLFNNVLLLVPDAISQIPAPQQAAALADFQRTIGLEITNATDLKADLLANNNTAAAGVVTQMDNTKRDGHTKYNPGN
jgi:hypothetical protein